MIRHRYAGARVSSHDPDKELMHLIYLNANNLYGYAMSQYLPVLTSNGYQNLKLIHFFQWKTLKMC